MRRYPSHLPIKTYDVRSLPSLAKLALYMGTSQGGSFPPPATNYDVTTPFYDS